MAVNPAALAPSEKRIAAALQHRFFLRLHMTAMLTATLLVGLLVTRVLFLIHLNIFAIRYALAVIAAYAAFVGFVKVWLWYVEFCSDRDRRRARAGTSSSSGGDWFNCLNLSSSGSSTTSSFSSSSDVLSSGGGHFGGGGASGSWDDGGDSKLPAVAAAASSTNSSRSTSSKSGGSGRGGGGDDLGELMLVVLIIAVLLAVVASFFWVIYAAPGILSEAAFNAALAGALVRHAHTATHGNWVGSVFKKTAIPFFLILALSVVLGWYAQHYCPEARRLSDAVHCVNPAF